MVDMSCTEAGASLNGPALLDYTVNGRALRRPGSPNSNRNQFPAMAPHGIYEAEGDDNLIDGDIEQRQQEERAEQVAREGQPTGAHPHRRQHPDGADGHAEGAKRPRRDLADRGLDRDPVEAPARRDD